MALTQAQWFKKLQGFVPSWYFEQSKLQRAHFMALAKLLADMQALMEEDIAQSFILQASDAFLDLHGYERSTPRVEGEPDSTYARRVQSLLSQSDKASIKAVVDSLLLIGTCEIREGNSADNIFCNRGSYLDRDEFYNGYGKNTFTIVLDRQVHAPYSYLSRGAYCDRLDAMGTGNPQTSIYDSIVAAVDAVKAFGVLYKIVERQ